MKLHCLNFRAAIWRFKEENRALMRRLYGEMDSPTLYREMRSTADKSSNNFQSSKNGGRKTKKETKVYMLYLICIKLIILISICYSSQLTFQIKTSIIVNSQNKVEVVQFFFHILLDLPTELRHFSLPLIIILE